MKNLIICLFFLCSLTAQANIFEVRGIFTTQEPFVATFEYDPNAIDSELLDPSEGDYYTWLGRITLDWGVNHVETSGSSMYVYRNHEGLSGIVAYNEHSFEWNGHTIGAKGLYFAAASPFIHNYFPSDSLDLITTLSDDPVWTSLSVTPYFEFNDVSGHLHFETDQPNPTFTVIMPEPSIAILFIFGMLQICLKKR